MHPEDMRANNTAGITQWENTKQMFGTQHDGRGDQVYTAEDDLKAQTYTLQKEIEKLEEETSVLRTTCDLRSNEVVLERRHLDSINKLIDVTQTKRSKLEVELSKDTNHLEVYIKLHDTVKKDMAEIEPKHQEALEKGESLERELEDLQWKIKHPEMCSE
ncbi:angiomotin-like protein 2 [Amia ocellicauda]|uniref:angiomotin-like protein 2 n=1 Tax=Amia ocellicauda TaxID=2972642 RepID=UPI003464D1F4